MTAAHTSEVLVRLRGSLDDWLGFMRQVGELDRLLSLPVSEQQHRGYFHTLREICQQPLTWLETGTAAIASLPVLRSTLSRVAGDGVSGSIVLTGSGSSVYAGECLAPFLQSALRVPASAVPAGEVLTHPHGSLPPRGPFLLVSLARSGNSPESCGVLDSVREVSTGGHHLVITCNRQGRLATSYAGDPRVFTLVLGDATCDR
ncbi:MAG: SIS domain-containing protein, partial [bacterium]